MTTSSYNARLLHATDYRLKLRSVGCRGEWTGCIWISSMFSKPAVYIRFWTSCTQFTATGDFTRLFNHFTLCKWFTAAKDRHYCRIMSNLLVNKRAKINVFNLKSNIRQYLFSKGSTAQLFQCSNVCFVTKMQKNTYNHIYLWEPRPTWIAGYSTDMAAWEHFRQLANWTTLTGNNPTLAHLQHRVSL